MLESLISSKTRIKLLLKFFLNSSMKGYLRGLEEEFGESSNAIRLELNKLEDSGMIESQIEGNKKYFTANKNHPLFSEISSIVRKYVGIDTIIENVVNNLGNVEKVYLTGNFAKGLNDSVIDLELVGNINYQYLSELVHNAEELVKRKIKYVVYSNSEFKSLENESSAKKLLIWSK